MDNYNLYALSSLPFALGSILNENTDVMDYFTNMDDSERTELISYAHDFKSKEDLENYINYLKR